MSALQDYVDRAKAVTAAARYVGVELIIAYQNQLVSFASKDPSSEEFTKGLEKLDTIVKESDAKLNELSVLIEQANEAGNRLTAKEKRSLDAIRAEISIKADLESANSTLNINKTIRDPQVQQLKEKANEFKPATTSKPTTENEGSKSGTAAAAVIVNDPAPPPPIKMEAATNDTGNAQASGDTKKEESIPGASQTAANIANPNETLARAAGNLIPPTNPGTIATPVNRSTAAFRGAGVLPPISANQEDAGESRAGNAATSAGTQYKDQEFGENPLHDYASYTYSFILAALQPKDYNNLVKQNVVFYNSGYKPQNVIIASGSRKNTQLPRDPRFEKDFYITDLKFTTVVGMNSRSRGSNVAEMQFKIVEPMGVSFFDRLYEMASALGFKNYLEIPYLLVIEFMGYNDVGTPDESSKLKSQTKFLPIKLAKVKLNITHAGSEYDVVAIPYNHAAYLTSEHGSAQANYQIGAKTVGQFFADKDEASVESGIKEAQRELNDELERLKILRESALNENAKADVRKATAEAQQTYAKKYFRAQSYAGALNAFERLAHSLKHTGQTHRYRFEIDPEIANSPIVEFNKLPATRAAFGNRDANRNKDQNVENDTDGLFAINAGTSNIDVINLVMKNSAYIRGQIQDLGVKTDEDPEVIAEKAGKPLKWFKIVPSVKILEYDEKRNIYAKEITYHIRPYLIQNTKSSLVPKSIIRNYMREYQYIFTGNNQDILDLAIEFDFLYYTMATVDKNKWAYLNSSPESAVDDIRVPSKNGAAGFQPLKVSAVSGNAPNQSGDASIDTSRGIAVGDLYNAVYGSAKGDMINVNLKIIGDPRYIKQDDVFFTPFDNKLNNTLDQSTLVNLEQNIALFDRNERFVKLTFKTPIDYAENGLLERNGDIKTSRFSGIYRVIKVENIFTRGKFEQNLQIVRVFGQDSDYERKIDEEKKKARERSEQIQAELSTGGYNGGRDSDARQPESTPIVGPAGSKAGDLLPKSSSFTVQPGALASLAANSPSSLTRLDSDPNLNPNETPSTPGIEDRDRLEALRIQNQAGDPDAITAEQVASNRRVNERLTAAFGIPPGARVPSQEDSSSSVIGA